MRSFSKFFTSERKKRWRKSKRKRRGGIEAEAEAEEEEAPDAKEPGTGTTVLFMKLLVGANTGEVTRRIAEDKMKQEELEARVERRVHDDET